MMDFSKPITTRPQAEAFLRELVESDYEFHLEDDPRDIVKGSTGEPLFTEEQAVQVEARVGELYKLDWSDHECPIGFMMGIENPGWRQR